MVSGSPGVELEIEQSYIKAHDYTEHGQIAFEPVMGFSGHKTGAQEHAEQDDPGPTYN